MLRYIKPHKVLCGLFLFGILLELAYGLAAPLSLQYLIDDALTLKNFQVFVIILSILIGVGFLNIVASMLGDYAIGKLSGEVIQKLRSELFVHLQKQSLPFYQRYKVGDLV